MLIGVEFCQLDLPHCTFALAALVLERVTFSGYLSLAAMSGIQRGKRRRMAVGEIAEDSGEESVSCMSTCRCHPGQPLPAVYAGLKVPYVGRQLCRLLGSLQNAVVSGSSPEAAYNLAAHPFPRLGSMFFPKKRTPRNSKNGIIQNITPSNS